MLLNVIFGDLQPEYFSSQSSLKLFFKITIHQTNPSMWKSDTENMHELLIMLAFNQLK